MENIKFNKSLFHEIYHGELTEEFEKNFVIKFGISYKDFLQLHFNDHNNSTKELAKLIGLKEKELLLQLKSYSIIKSFNIKEWKRYLTGNIFVFVLKAILAAIGSIPIFYFIGYLILYGYFFGQTNHSLLDVVIKNVPLNRSSCYIAGFIFSGIVAFFISLYKLKGIGKTFLIFGLIYFFFASTISLLLILFNANSSFEILIMFKFLLVWFFPVLVSVLLISISFLVNVLSKHYKTIGLMLIICCFIPLISTKKFGLMWSLTLYLVIVISLSAIVIKFIESDWRSATKERSKKQKPNPEKFKFSFSEFLFFILFVISLFVVIVVPMLCFIMFSTGNYIGSTLSLVGLTTSEDIKIKDTLISGKLITEDDNYLYISTTSRTLLEISKDSSIQITKPNELTMYTGKSRDWSININVFYRGNEMWYSGVINKLNSSNTVKLTYQLEKLDKITLVHSNPKSQFYILDRLSPETFKKFTYVNLSWLSSNGSIEKETLVLNVSDID
ncbi:hypothetical protein [Paenibacillus polymyxa]|uniref:hypothetical protein n=1 Tax=Paenibacillus polymyxa TaxID=1406 RepID=UPI0025B6AF1A|nr:hypothetical protein [Paenibacillus polymyxa]MDN4083289.1 hypothetical protein [Paenibacillus polymyxa]MDN4089598.1 hypothetical protein [Paenibacillus polymyxa]MDN4110258.1 hypothetical protein [Paenibacillus polymyxa]